MNTKTEEKWRIIAMTLSDLHVIKWGLTEAIELRQMWKDTDDPRYCIEEISAFRITLENLNDGIATLPESEYNKIKGKF